MGWQDVGKSSGGGNYFKLEDNAKGKIHVLGEEVGGPAEPHSFQQYFNRKVSRGAVVGDDYVGTVDKRWQHAFVVYDYSDSSIKLWVVGNRVAAQLQGIMEGYEQKSLATVDLNVQRKGIEKKTTYIITAISPSKFDDTMLEGLEIPDLATKFAPASQETIDNLKLGIVEDNEEAAASDVETEAVADPEPEVEAEAAAEEPAAEPEPEDEEAALEAQIAALKAKKAAAAKAVPAKGGVATKVAPAKAAPAKGVTAGDPRIALVKTITHQFATNAKYKTPTARMAAIKAVAKGKTTLSQLSVAELTILKGKTK